MAGLNERESAAVHDLVDRLRRRLGKRLVEVRLYGSKARRTDTVESDIDLAVIVGRVTPQLREMVFTDVSDVIIEHDVFMDVHVVSTVHMRRLRRIGAPYARNLDREGIAI